MLVALLIVTLAFSLIVVQRLAQRLFEAELAAEHHKQRAEMRLAAFHALAEELRQLRVKTYDQGQRAAAMARTIDAFCMAQEGADPYGTEIR